MDILFEYLNIWIKIYMYTKRSSSNQNPLLLWLKSHFTIFTFITRQQVQL